MVYIIIAILVIGGVMFLIANKKKKVLNTRPKITQQTIKPNPTFDDGLSFSDRLNKTKELYPFQKWRDAFFEFEMEQYTEENCNSTKLIFDNLITSLIALGENGNEDKKIKIFEIAVISLNNLSEKVDDLIETGEREDLCELIDQITIASGLNPENYSDGEGLSDLWREW